MSCELCSKDDKGRKYDLVNDKYLEDLVEKWGYEDEESVLDDGYEKYNNYKHIKYKKEYKVCFSCFNLNWDYTFLLLSCL